MKRIQKHITGYSVVKNAYLIDIKSFNEEMLDNRIIKPKRYNWEEYEERVNELFPLFVKYVKKNKIMKIVFEKDENRQYHNDFWLDMNLGGLSLGGHLAYHKTPPNQPIEKPPKPFSGKVDDIQLMSANGNFTTAYSPYIFKGINKKQAIFELPSDYKTDSLKDLFMQEIYNFEDPDIRERNKELGDLFK